MTPDEQLRFKALDIPIGYKVSQMKSGKFMFYPKSKHTWSEVEILNSLTLLEGYLACKNKEIDYYEGLEA